jgi:hypothetical protein
MSPSHCHTRPSSAWRLVLSITVAVGIMGTAGVAEAAYQFTPPTDLAPGAPYQLLFTTEGSIQAYSASLSTYQGFVQSEAAKNAFLPTTTWNPIAFVYNSGYLPSSVATDAPLYNLLGHRLLDHASQLFTTGADETINGVFYAKNAVSFSDDLTSSNGASLASNTTVWTGTDYANSAASYTQLGNDWYGYANFALYQSGAKVLEWKNSNGYNYDSEYAYRPLLAMSGVIVPEPAAVIVWSLLGGLVITTVRWWRRRHAA